MRNMSRLIFITVALAFVVGPSLGETIRVTTWNLEWFPSGSMKVATPEVQAANIKAAAQVLSVINADVVLLQEIQDFATCEKLAQAMAPLKYTVHVCSEFRDNFGGGVGRQQVAIMAKQKAKAAWSEDWKIKGAVDPPRGFAFAVIPFGKHDLAFYSVHLKSNLVRSGNQREPQLNIAKRELAAEQLIDHSKGVLKLFPNGFAGVVVGGDFNTNRDQDLFISEKTLTVFDVSGFVDPFKKMPLAQRVTHPGKGQYPDATFDYILAKGVKLLGAPAILQSKVSDHFPVTLEIQLPE